MTHEKFVFADLIAKAKNKDLGLSELYLAQAFGAVDQIPVFPKTIPHVDRKILVDFYNQLAEQVLLLVKPDKK